MKRPMAIHKPHPVVFCQYKGGNHQMELHKFLSDNNLRISNAYMGGGIKVEFSIGKTGYSITRVLEGDYLVFSADMKRFISCMSEESFNNDYWKTNNSLSASEVTNDINMIDRKVT